MAQDKDVIARLAAACKAADDTGVDFGQQLAKLETLRQTSAARHSVLREGAERGGGAAGLGLGGGARRAGRRRRAPCGCSPGPG
jgi:hypothetical protein